MLQKRGALVKMNIHFHVLLSS